MEPSLELPARPELRPGIELVPLEGDRVLLRSFAGSLMLSGDFVASKLPEVLPLLDGTRTIEAVAETVGGGYRPELDHLLRALAEKGLLGEGDGRGADRGPGDRRHERAYWAVASRGAGDPMRRLGSSVVLVIGLGGVGTSLVRALASAGVGTILGVDPGRVRESDETLGYDRADVGKSRAEATAARINEAGRASFRPVAVRVGASGAVADLVKEAHLVAVAGDNMALAPYETINELCLRHGTPWVSARIDRNRGIIGPFVVPGQSACFTCFELRSRANSEHPADHEATYRRWRQTDGLPDDWPTIAPALHLVGNTLALDVLRVLGHRDVSAALGRVLYVEFQTLASSVHPVLKLPRCPSCSRGRHRPLSKIWDV